MRHFGRTKRGGMSLLGKSVFLVGEGGKETKVGVVTRVFHKPSKRGGLQSIATTAWIPFHKTNVQLILYWEAKGSRFRNALCKRQSFRVE